jgi:hypothetical protein
MTQFARHRSYLMIEDKLDAIGQKYRGLRIMRGAMLFVIIAAAATVLASLIAHFAGQGHVARGTLFAYMGVIAGGFVWWIVRPVLLRPANVEMARLIETRIPELHNGLTNSVLLARASDLQDSPWIGPILDEVLASTQDKPLGSAVSVKDLRGLGLRLAIVAAAIGVLLSFSSMRTVLAQGWRQMISPATFVPKVGSVRIIELYPREVTLVVGQPLEITVLAEDPDNGLPTAKLIYDNPKMSPAELSPALNERNQLKYTYRLDHVEVPMRWRVEIGATQGEWCVVKVVKQVKLSELSLIIKPPAYTHRAEPAPIVMKADEVGRTPVAVLEGSRVTFSALVDVPVKGALVQIDQEQPAPMDVVQGGLRMTASFVVMHDLEVSALLTEAGQVIAKLPDPGLRIACTRDSAPVIEMKWPAQDTTVAPKAELKLSARLKDDVGLASARVMMATSADGPLTMVQELPLSGTAYDLAYVLNVPDEARVHGKSIKVQVEVTDNRDFGALVNTGLGSPTSAKDAGAQTTRSAIYEIKFRDPDEIAKEQKEQLDQLRALLMEMLKKQTALHDLAAVWKPSLATMPRIHDGQGELKQMMEQTASTFPFEPEDKIVQKMLLVLIQNPAREAIDLSQQIQTEPVEGEKIKLNKELESRQRRIIEVLETLISRLNNPISPTTQPAKRGGDLEAQREKYKELDEALKKFMADEKRIADATASLAKKPVDNFDDNDKKLLEELKQSQDKLDAFMQEKIADFSKLAEQDMANASLLKDMMQVYSEVTMAKDALKKQAVEMAIPAEEMGLEKAKEIESNLEKWLSNEPDRQKWNQEDPLTKNDIPMAELPKELEDMVGELLEQQEDLNEDMEDTAANWADSMDKGAGWDAADGPIANMSAKGVTGNQLPNNNEMNGRSGEGRSGKSQGEFVGDTAQGKGGRNTPTRLDPTPFQQGQIKDESKDPVGGATGGGKMSGQGGQGLEGPVPPKDLKDKMERLATKQAEIRNKAERIQLEQKVSRYDNFKLMEAMALMRRVESDIHSNRYNTAMRRKDILLDKLDTSHLLLSGQIHLQKDSSPTASDRLNQDINDVTTGQLPAAWSDALKEYYKRLSQQ